MQQVKKVRIGKDIRVRWRITVNGAPADLEKMDLRLEVVDRFSRKYPLQYIIEGGEIVFAWEGKQQQHTGAHTLTLWANWGKSGQAVVDRHNFVELVPLSFMETTESLEADNMSFVDNITIGVQGKSAFESWLSQGNKGSESDFIAWIQKPAHDAQQESAEQNKLMSQQEEERKAAEHVRVVEEQKRNAAEQERNTEEGKRDSSESMRVEAEKLRVTNFAKLSEDMQGATKEAAQAAESVDVSKQQAVAAAQNANEQAEKAKVEADRMVSFTTSINVSNAYPTGSPNQSNIYTLESAINVIEERYRTVGLKCSFLTSPREIEEYQYVGGEYQSLSSWVRTDAKSLDNRRNEIDTAREDALKRINQQKVTPDMLSAETKQYIDAAGGGTITNNADGTDLTSELVDGTNVIRFADRKHEPTKFNGKGRIYLRPNIVGGKNVLTQDVMQQENTVYVIRDDYDLENNIVNVPNGCVLQFDGGSISNGVMNNVKSVIADKDSVIFKSVIVSGLMMAYTRWFNILSDLNVSKADDIQKLIDMNITTILFNDGVYYIDKPLRPKKNQIINLEGSNAGLNKDIDYWYANFDGKGVVLAPKEGTGAFILNCYCNIIGGVIDYNYKHDFEADNGCQQTAIFVDYSDVDIRGTRISCSIHDYYKESVNSNHNSVGIRIGTSNNKAKGSAFNLYLNTDIKHFGIGLQIDEWITDQSTVLSWCTSVYYDGCIWNCKRALDIKGGQGSFFKGMIQSGLTDFSDNVFVNIATTQCIFDMYIWDFNQSHGNNRYIYVNRNLNYVSDYTINEYMNKIKWINNTIVADGNGYIYNKYFRNICAKGELSNYTAIESCVDNVLLGADKFHKVEFFKDDIIQQPKKGLFSLFGNEFNEWLPGVWRIKITFSSKHNLPFIAVCCNAYIIQYMKLTQYFDNNGVKSSKEVNMERINNNINSAKFNGYYYSRELDTERNIYYNDIDNLYNTAAHTEAIEISFKIDKTEVGLLSLFIAKDLNIKNGSYFFSVCEDNTFRSNYSFEQNWNDKSTFDNKGINSIRMPTVRWRPSPTDNNKGIMLCQYNPNGGSYLETVLFNSDNQLVNQRCVTYTPTYRYGETYYQNLAEKDLKAYDAGYIFFNTETNKKSIWNGSKWVDDNGDDLDVKKIGTTSQRPASVHIGFTYKDTDLGKWIIWNGSAWENIDGTALA